MNNNAHATEQSYQHSLQQLVQFFETISPDSVQRIPDIYSADAYFKDPFNEVRGVEAVKKIFAHMFVQVEAPRFIVTNTVLQGDQAFLCWEFIFRFRRFSNEEQCVRGVTHFRFDSDGKVSMHRDYWDAAEELYEKLPVLRHLMRWLRRTASQ